jgi:hypothetical protein
MLLIRLRNLAFCDTGKKQAQLVAESLITLFDRFGFGAPKIIHNDNGTEFDNA